MVADLAYLEAEHDSDPGVQQLVVVKGGRRAVPQGPERSAVPLTTTGIIIKHNKKRPPDRAGLQATRAPQSAAHTRLFWHDNRP